MTEGSSKQMLDRRRLLMSGAALACSSAAFVPAAARPPAFAPTSDRPPAARVDPVSETLFGVAITDRYRWMEAEGPEWRGWVDAEGAYAGRVLDAIPGRDDLRAAVLKATDYEQLRDLQIVGDLVFTETFPVGASTPKVFVQKGQDGNKQMLLDAAAFASAGSHAAIDWWRASPDGAHVVFGVSLGGSEQSVTHVLAVTTGKLLPESLAGGRYGLVSWAPDGSGFFYNRLRAGVQGTDMPKRTGCWFHRLGTDQAADVKVLAQATSTAVPMGDVDRPAVFAKPESDIVIARIVNGVEDEAALYVARVADAMAGRAEWRRICMPEDGVTMFDWRGNDIYLLSHKSAPRFQVLKVTGAEPAIAVASVVVPQAPSVIDSIAVARDGLYLAESGPVLGGVSRLGWDGRITSVKTPFAARFGYLITDVSQGGVWFVARSWTRPITLCRTGADGVAEVVALLPNSQNDPSPYRSIETSAASRDGTAIPLSIIWREGTRQDGTAPLLLQAYGAYGVTFNPVFQSDLNPFLDLGGVVVVAHVRGGGELGEDWRKAGQKLTKPNTWRDMIDAAEHLIRTRWTNPGKLAIRGGSAGGIAVGRFMTERPELAAVVISEVGVSNTLRAEFSPGGPSNIPEFGTITERDGFKALYAMDSYQHVVDHVRYPSVLLTTGLNDPRVASWQSSKMTARLQAATGSSNPVLLRVEADAGHGIGSTRDQNAAEQADELAFVLWRTGDLRFQPKA